MSRRPRGKPRIDSAKQAREAVEYATRICAALGPVQGELREVIRLKKYQLGKRSSIQRETIAQIEGGGHGAGLFVVAAIGYVLAGSLPRFARDLHRAAEELR